MNYGFDNPNFDIQLDETKEAERFSIQLYHHLAHKVEIKDKHIVDIGCGRGGGLAFIDHKFSPSSAVGIDLEPIAVRFANGKYRQKG